MIVALIILGVLSLIAGSGLAWLNLNTPFQTFLPAIFLPAGGVMVLLAVGGLLL